MWNTLPIEDLLRQRLSSTYPGAEGDEFYGDYLSARRDVIEQVIPQIRSVEPQLTDHGPDHVANVLRNAYSLLGPVLESDQFSALDLYALCMTILFHDVGNVFGRDDHQTRIAEIYTAVRGNPIPDRFKRERSIVQKAGGAHTGVASDGTDDTLKELGYDHLKGERIQLRDIAAILRFADELAEGPQRTSRFLQTTGFIDPESEIYHNYASCTEICADRGNERIALTYDIEVGDSDWHSNEGQKAELYKLLNFIYRRIIKLDQERKYTKHYCQYLSPFKITSVRINFSYSTGVPFKLDLGELTLTDLTVPGEQQKPFPEIYPQCDPDTLVMSLQNSEVT